MTIESLPAPAVLCVDDVGRAVSDQHVLDLDRIAIHSLRDVDTAKQNVRSAWQALEAYGAQAGRQLGLPVELAADWQDHLNEHTDHLFRPAHDRLIEAYAAAVEALGVMADLSLVPSQLRALACRD